MYFVKTPELAQLLYGECLWHCSREEKKLFLTFDDGPEPSITPLILDKLKQYNAKASFFMLGKQVEQFPEFYEIVHKDGHAIGNHTHNHPDGWKTGREAYLHDIRLANEHIHSGLFRPPYGRARWSQLHEIRKHFRVVMWDILSGDFDTRLNGELCFKRMQHKINAGSIIVFHERKDCTGTTLEALERVLFHYTDLGFEFCSLR